MTRRDAEGRIRTTTMVPAHLADVFDALAYLTGLRPHELAASIVADALEAAAADVDVDALIRNLRRHRSGLTVVDDGDAAGMT